MRSTIMASTVFGYWNVRGLGEYIRFLLNYVGENYEEKTYNYTSDKSDWLKEKFSLGLDFPNLPYYIDGEVKLTQSLAIMRYLARKYHLLPEKEEDQVRVDVFEQQCRDMIMGLIMLVLNPDYQNMKEEYVKNFEDTLKRISSFLGDREWFAGKLTYVDFLAYEVLDHHRYFIPKCVNKHENLKKYMERFEKLPAIEKYMKSGKFKEWPLYGPRTYWGSGKERPAVDK